MPKEGHNAGKVGESFGMKLQEIRGFYTFSPFSTTFPSTPHPPLVEFVVLHVRGGGYGGWKVSAPRTARSRRNTLQDAALQIPPFLTLLDFPRVIGHLSPTVFDFLHHLPPRFTPFPLVVFDTFGAGCPRVGCGPPSTCRPFQGASPHRIGPGSNRLPHARGGRPDPRRTRGRVRARAHATLPRGICPCARVYPLRPMQSHPAGCPGRRGGRGRARAWGTRVSRKRDFEIGGNALGGPAGGRF